jgi:hypothetical protein
MLPGASSGIGIECPRFIAPAENRFELQGNRVRALPGSVCTVPDEL